MKTRKVATRRIWEERGFMVHFGEGAALETASDRPPCPFPMKRVQIATESRNAPYRAVLERRLGLYRDRTLV